ELCFQAANVLMVRIPFSGLFNEFIKETPSIKTGAVPTIGQFFTYYTFYASAYSFVLISLNRLIIIVFQKSYRLVSVTANYKKRVFPLRNTGIGRFLSFSSSPLYCPLPSRGISPSVAPSSSSSKAPSSPTTTKSSELLVAATSFAKHLPIQIQNSRFTVYNVIIVSVFTATVNAVIIVHIVKNRTKRNDWVEIKLFFLTVANFICQCIHCAFQTLAYLGVCYDCFATIFMVHPFLVDFTCFLNPWFLMMTSTAFRQSARELLSCGKKSVVRINVQRITISDHP
uniref:Serpentine receptor class gamma n=1 Tax=Steinernema glaseri TaxID=37863 RepID=A0A1I8ATQ3_9BILA